MELKPFDQKFKILTSITTNIYSYIITHTNGYQEMLYSGGSRNFHKSKLTTDTRMKFCIYARRACRILKTHHWRSNWGPKFFKVLPNTAKVILSWGRKTLVFQKFKSFVNSSFINMTISVIIHVSTELSAPRGARSSRVSVNK